MTIAILLLNRVYFCYSPYASSQASVATAEFWWFSRTNERHCLNYSSVREHVERFNAKKNHFTNHGEYVMKTAPCLKNQFTFKKMRLYLMKMFVITKKKKQKNALLFIQIVQRAIISLI